MLIVYDPLAKYIKNIVLIQNQDPDCESIYTDGRCQYSFHISDQPEMIPNKYKYYVDDSDPANPILQIKTRLIIEFTCDQTLISENPLVYEMPYINTATLTVTFKDEAGNLLTPVGTLEFGCSRGALNTTSVALDGTISSVTNSWQPPQETINTSLWVYIKEMDIDRLFALVEQVTPSQEYWTETARMLVRLTS